MAEEVVELTCAAATEASREILQLALGHQRVVDHWQAELDAGRCETPGPARALIAQRKKLIAAYRLASESVFGAYAGVVPMLFLRMMEPHR